MVADTEPMSTIRRSHGLQNKLCMSVGQRIFFSGKTIQDAIEYYLRQANANANASLQLCIVLDVLILYHFEPSSISGLFGIEPTDHP